MTGGVRALCVSAAVVGCFSGCRADPPAQVNTDAAVSDVPVAIPRCRPTEGVSAAPTSIAELLALVNALPRPLTMVCFLESLDRPLFGVGTTSVLSLQPAMGARSPRIFLMSGALTLAIVPDGSGRQLLEFGQMVTETRSVKGEIAFPVWTEVTPSAPFEKLFDPALEPGAGTTCRVCHADEQPHEAFGAGAFSSTAFRPLTRARVSLESLRAERQSCDSAVEADRCAFLGALFDHGDVLARDFPEIIPTFTAN